MDFKVVGTSQTRWDAEAKVTGKAEYTRDIPMHNLLYGKVVRSKIAHGRVINYNLEEALKVPGVIKILTADDVPEHTYSTAGHPHKLNVKFQDKKDTNIFTRRVRYFGDAIGAVIAETELAAEIAVNKIKIDYEQWPFYLNSTDALQPGAKEIHDGSGNLVADTTNEYGDVDKAFKEAKYVFEDEYHTQTVQHCHLETMVAYAYKDVDNRWVCISSTQIPHICRHILGDAFNMPFGRFRVIKPFVGGGFGNKQDIVIEPLVMAMSMAVDGKPVVLEMTREELFVCSRVRHANDYKMKIAIDENYHITGIDMDVLSQNGAYTSHGHTIALVGEEAAMELFNVENFRARSRTVYTNTAVGGAMRAYGTPQAAFALNSLAGKAARELGIDQLEFQMKNVPKSGELCNGTQVMFFTSELSECLRVGRDSFDWVKRNEDCKKFNLDNSDRKRGLGVGTLIYATNTKPHSPSIESSGCRLILNQDGSVKMMIGATEIGQGSDTVLAQMAAEVLGISYDNVYVDKYTDTDVSPFDPGSFASRQTYVSGMAVKKAAEVLKVKILEAYILFTPLYSEIDLDLVDGYVVFKKTGKKLESLGDLALKTYYDFHKGNCLTADVSINCQTTAYSGTACLAYVEVDTKTGKVEILDIMNVHDAGKIINPMLASGQVEGGMAMGIAYGLGEELLYDYNNGKPLNNNLLDYKMPTCMDVPDLKVAFVEPIDPTGPFGNKSLGEPPLSAPAPAIRNAVANAIGLEINSIPLTPQRVLETLNK
ncbi:MAG: xanthine dehydrogenase molybdenum-binding subunit XdhA [Firmicutes bacterium]|nr:xanthine dehydrogenase molybdenum-binding subunit XdhA [Bacillota bacterium]